MPKSLILLISIPYWLVCSCTPKKNDDAGVGGLKARQNIQVNMDENIADGVTFLYSENGKMKSKLTCKVFVQNDVAVPAYIDMLKGVKVVMYDSLLHPQTQADALRARYYPQNGNILAQGKVVASNSRGDSLFTEELIWNEKQQKYFTEKPVRIVHEGETTVGTGMIANKDFSDFKVFRQVGYFPSGGAGIPNE